MGKQYMERINELLKVDMKRKEDCQDIGFNSRPFVLCGLPYHSQDDLDWERRNGDLYLRVEGSSKHGLPYGQDRIVPIFLATKAIQQQSREIIWDTAGEVLDLFGLSRAGSNYQRLIERFKRIFSATIFFGNEDEEKGLVWERFHFMDRMQLWFKWKDFDTKTLPMKREGEDGEEIDTRNHVVLSEPFWNELKEHPIPIDISAVSALTDSPGALDFYCWLCWRSWTARQPVRIPLESESGLFAQFGMKQSQPDWKKRQTLKDWMKRVKMAWRDCPAHLSEDGKVLVVPPAKALNN
jgi:hypothetical protein